MDNSYESNLNDPAGYTNPEEYEAYMAQTYGPEWKTGFRVGFGKRLGAFVIDVIIVILLSTLLMLILPYEGLDSIIGAILSGDLEALQGMEENALAIAQDNMIPELVSNTILLLYWALEAFLGFTVGKKLLKIKIADVNLRHNKKALWTRFLVKHSYSIIGLLAIPFGFVVMTAVGLVTGLLFFVIVIGCFFVLGARKQALHDMIAGTAVFNDESLEWNRQNV